jgi:hypothetical protein
MRRALASALAATLLLSLSGCSSDDDSKSEKKSSTATPSEGATGKRPKMSVDKVEPKTITDDAFGHTVKATKVVRNFPLPSTMSGVEKGTELVLVHVTAKAGKKYVPLSDGDFRLSTTKDPRKGVVATPMAETEMTDAGYPPFGEVAQGKRGAGWLAFLVEDATDGPLYLSYKRLAFDNGDIPEKTITVPLNPAG